MAYTDSKWKQMGEKVGEGVHGYMQLVIKADMLRQEKQKCKKMVPKNITKKNGRSVSNTNNHSRAKNDINLLEKPCQSLILEGIED